MLLLLLLLPPICWLFPFFPADCVLVGRFGRVLAYGIRTSMWNEKALSFIAGAVLAYAGAAVVRREMYVHAKLRNTQMEQIRDAIRGIEHEEAYELASEGKAGGSDDLFETRMRRQMALSWNRALDKLYIRTVDFPDSMGKLCADLWARVTR